MHLLLVPCFFRQAHRGPSYIKHRNALQLATASLVVSSALTDPACAQDIVVNNGQTAVFVASRTLNSVTNNGGVVSVAAAGVTLNTNFVQQGGTTRIAAGGTLSDSDGVVAVSGGELQNNGGGTISSAVSISGGTLTASGGTFGGNVTISGAGTLNLDSSAIVGTTTMTGGNIDVNNGSTLQTDLVQSGGTTTIKSGGTLTDSGGTTLSGGVIENSGTITNAVALTGGTLTNTTGGTVNGLTTVQSGTLNASGGTFVGGVTAQGGTVNITTSQTLDLTNNGSVININTGVNLTDDLVNNSGTLNIAGTLTGNLTNSATVYVAGTITGNVINNSSLIFNRSDAPTYGGAISGTGSLTKSGAGTLTLTGSSTHTGGTVISAGTLQIGDGGTSGNIGGDISNSAALVFNRADALTYGGAISGTGSLTKSGAGTLTLTGSSTHTGGTVISAGTLQIGDGGTSGSIVGDISNSAALVFNRSDALTYGGAISGTGSLTKSGAGTLTLTGSSTHTGGTVISAGTLQIGDGGTSGSIGGDITNNADLIFNRSDALTYGSVISGSGSLTKSGAGTLTLTEVNTHTGGTTVSAGKLVVNGSIGAITLNGGTLGGSGTVGGFTARSGSKIAPGNSIGTLNVAGNAMFDSGSAYEVEVDSAGNADRIVATGGVNIDSDATVNILAENGTDDGSGFAPSTTYTIITAGTAVTGKFGTVTDNFAFLDAALGYDDPKAVTLTLTRNASSFASVGKTANQRAVANAVSSGATGNRVFDAVVGLSADGARAAFDSLSGEIHASLPSLFLNDSARLRDTVTSRIHDAFAGFSEVPEIAFNGPVGPRGPGLGTGSGFNLTTWGSAYGAYGKLDGDGNAATLSRSTGGALVGLEATAWPQARFGLLAGLGQSQASVSARASSADANSYTLGAYGGVRLSDLGLTFGAAYCWHDVTSERAVAAGGLKDTLTADYWSRTAQVFGEASYALETPWLQVSPFAGLALLHQQTDAFQEQGSAALALTGDGSSQLLGSSTLGLRMSKTLATTDSVSVALTGAFGWRHAIGDLTPDQRMALSGLDPFTVQGVPLDRDTALVEAGLALTITDRTTLGLSYQGAFGENASDQGANARVNIRF
ncbi:Outer membrane autotransporter barrel [Stappia aggregata IAM 12614]|uniref:Outer membrane autotransporter barrel n=1 Tax=Roseibium aggregatum (strain ATCC 25650 / DSM 13394 / JCM 20685 / NBRC 16684 / NCIMB 2208 / IAM 12614 / B1) TaxID=384765 RepID=A0P3V5_ROSAI|nr:autotransporter domain-containing protein [Roseibium aggregatum]EAV40299.1 Outer membrane autotransporter barrel [Stappia aggregata IAM 12614] [Roseibium aggregatum IAM 12614]